MKIVPNEKLDIHFIYEYVNRNSKLVTELYRKTFSIKRYPCYLFARLKNR